jgi:tetratricopeptide (TPR) repeat protein
VLAGGAAAAKLIAAMREPAPAPAAAPAQVAPRASQRPTPPVLPAAVEPAEPAPLDVTPEPRASRASAGRGRDAREHVLEDLLQQANRARADGEFREAAALYAEVYESRPSSLSAYVALVAAASLELEHLDRPARARKLFETALAARPKGALDLEARQGLVLALRDLGARNEEIAALRKLIALHPSRPAAARARARLAELGE